MSDEMTTFTPADPTMAAAIRELQAARSQFNLAATPAEIDAANSRLQAAHDRIMLIITDAGHRPARIQRNTFRLPWVARLAGRRELRCAG